MQQLNVDYNRIQIFLTLVEVQSFTKAAQVLKQPKSRVSRNIAALEKELNTQLIYRTTRQFQLTDAGKKFYQNCREHFLQIKEAITQMTDSSSEISGSLRLTAPDDLSISILSRVCSEFMLRYPAVKLDLLITNSIVDLVKQGVDLALRVGQPKNNAFLSRKLGRISLSVVASPEYLLRFQTSVTPENIHQHICLASAFSDKPDEWKVSDPSGRKLVFKFSPAVICTNHFVLKNLVLEGRGLAILPKFTVQNEIKSGLLIDVLKNYTAETNSVYLLMPPQKKISLKVRRMIDLMVEHLQKELN